MLIAALVLAVIGLAALITAVATSNELIAWVCIGASGLGIVLLIIDAIRERFRRPVAPAAVAHAVLAPAVAEPAAEAVALAESETTEVLEPIAEAVVVEDEVVDEAEVEVEDGVESELDYGTGDFADEPEIASSDVVDSAIAVEDHPEEVVHDEPDYDLPTDDEVEFPEPAEVAALHIVSDDATEEYVAAEEPAEEYVAAEYPAVEYAATEYPAAEYPVVEYTAAEYAAEEGQTAVADAYDTTVTAEYVVETVEEHLGSGDGDSTTEIRYIPSAEGSADTVYTYSEGSEIEYIEAQESEVTDGGQ